jgi:hypothetical protein
MKPIVGANKHIKEKRDMKGYTMRKLIVCNIMSLDRYYTGPDNTVMVVPMDQPSTPIAPSGCARPIRCCWGVRRTMG